MKEIATASRELEQAKMDVQLELFTKQMDYNRARDMQLSEQSLIINDNARLTIEKQSQVVQCLSNLSHVLSSGLHHRIAVHVAPVYRYPPAQAPFTIAPIDAQPRLP